MAAGSVLALVTAVVGWTIPVPWAALSSIAVDTVAETGSAVAGGPARALTVVGLGDSVTAGTACDCEDFVHRYAGLVTGRTGRPAVADNDGVPGLTSGQLLDQLRSGGPMSGDVRRGDVVLITIGANDLAAALGSWRGGGCDDTCSTRALPAVSRNVERIVTQVRQLRGGRATRIVVTDYWNVFVDGQRARTDYGSAYLAWSDHLTRVANAAICAAAARAQAGCVDLYAPFKGNGDVDPTSHLAADGDHPNGSGHRLIARAIAAQAMP